MSLLREYLLEYLLYNLLSKNRNFKEAKERMRLKGICRKFSLSIICKSLRSLFSFWTM